MKLRYSAASPFARKVVIVGHVLGLADRIELVGAEEDPGDVLRSRNPLNKIPMLLTDDGQAIFDSRVIVEFLDHLAGGGRVIPAESAARFDTLTLQALADGISEAAVLIVYEGRYRNAEHYSERWISHQQVKIDTALDHLESRVPGNGADVGTIALACALGFLDLRAGGKWRATHPKLVAWLDAFSTGVPAFGKTIAAS
jgi:glutathione S-transferase